jgi:hypothetical protein
MIWLVLIYLNHLNLNYLIIGIEEEETGPTNNVDPFRKSALPEQPMPNQQVIQPQQQAAITQSGLTPTESALLSPAEQQIRLKQRGLA